jgi:hypothetical protein
MIRLTPENAPFVKGGAKIKYKDAIRTFIRGDKNKFSYFDDYGAIFERGYHLDFFVDPADIATTNKMEPSMIFTADKYFRDMAAGKITFNGDTMVVGTKSTKKKMLIIGQGRSGKDTFAEVAEERGYKFKSSSQAAADIFIFDALKHFYHSSDECYRDRHNNRALWHSLICFYNKDDKARLAKEIMKDNDIYVGMRDTEEMYACLEEGLFDIVVWIDASERVGDTEDESSNNIKRDDAHIIIENNGTENEFRHKVHTFLDMLE